MLVAVCYRGDAEVVGGGRICCINSGKGRREEWRWWQFITTREGGREEGDEAGRRSPSEVR